MVTHFVGSAHWREAELIIRRCAAICAVGLGLLTCLTASAFAQGVIVADHDALALAGKINTAVKWHCIPQSVYDAWANQAATLFAALYAEIDAAESALPQVKSEQPESDFGKKRQAKHVQSLNNQIASDEAAAHALRAALQSASEHICPPEDETGLRTIWTGGLYASLELGGGWWNNTITFGRDPSVNAGGFVGGGAFGFRMPVNGIPDSLVWPVGARVGVLGGSFNSSTVANGTTLTVKTPLALYGEAEFANPIFSSLAGRLIPHTVIYSSAGIAGVWQNYGWSMPGLGGNTNTVQFAFTTSIRAEWKITRTIDFYVQWRSFLATPQQFNLPGLATANGYSNMVTLGVQF
jgi:hypothetical protein